MKIVAYISSLTLHYTNVQYYISEEAEETIGERREEVDEGELEEEEQFKKEGKERKKSCVVRLGFATVFRL